jgi:DNA primase small subunit
MNYLVEECYSSMSHQEQTKRIIFLKSIIREYYSRKPLEEPGELHKREIALESLEDGAYIRHLSFPYMHLLYDFILHKKTPTHLYYSSALYSTPDAPKMEDKGWEGSELMFDVDADKLPGCEKKLWICPLSNMVSETTIDTCPKGENPIEYSWLSWGCILKAWRGVLNLIDILREEFGFTNIRVYFSGNRGFHVKVYDPEVLEYTREMRKAIADYVSCEGLNREKLFPIYRGQVLFAHREYGIRKRVLDMARTMNLVVKKVIGGKREFEAISVDSLKEVLSLICVDVDKAVTMDISRLSRFGNSLNMKAGLRVVWLDIDKNLEDLSFRDFSPFKGELKVKSLVTADIEVFDNKMTLKRGEVYKFEAHVGLYLILKKLAEPIDYSGVEIKI